MVINFKARGINRGTRKLTRTPTSIKKIVFVVGQEVFFAFLS